MAEFSETNKEMQTNIMFYFLLSNANFLFVIFYHQEQEKLLIVIWKLLST